MKKFALALLAVGSLFTCPLALAGEEEEEVFPTWEELESEYAADYAAVEFLREVTIEITFSTHGDFYTKIKYAHDYAIFDPLEAEHLLNQEFLLPPGAKVKKKSARSVSLKGSVRKAEKDEFQTKKVYGGWKEVRVAIPGLDSPGYAKVRVEAEWKTAPLFSVDLVSNLPLRKGRIRLECPPSQHRSALQYFSIRRRGSLKEAEVPKKKAAEFILQWEAENLPPLTESSFYPALIQPAAALEISVRGSSWNLFSKVMYDEVRSIRLPKDLVKTFKKEADLSTPEATFASVVSWVENPKNIATFGTPRDMVLGFGTFKDFQPGDRLSILEKAVFAKRLMDECKLQNQLVFASSQYRSALNWASLDYDQLDAPLILVSGLGPSFLWDVGAPWVPMGFPGPDLYGRMLVMEEDEETDPILSIKPSPFYHAEKRTLELSLEDDGFLSGDLSCQFNTTSRDERLQPWTKSAEGTKAAIDAALLDHVSVGEVAWSKRGSPLFRCSEDSPAVLTCAVEMEAEASGASGWSVSPFVTELPRYFSRIEERDQDTVFLLTEGLKVSEAVMVHLGEMSATAVPEPLQLRNASGEFTCRWQPQGNNLVALRRLVIHPDSQAMRSSKLVSDLCKIWSESGSKTVFVE
ncbi:MAG: hypothetical protein HKN21_13145 [Candidatus Eisenbacteria bacterium]|uniref:DUF3857 domain-containing protein n=1 Tax=Eiseniibacteriota bacterium TaxID=2212470 RepID=A0A7Y2H3D0_UNCEI|nr:hypothetical protein [Candidatus Eisenbacteria bacterium]